MKGKFTSLKKLLCYVIISLFMFGIGGELVKADTLTINSVQWLGNFQTARYAKFNAYLNGESRYAYCFDAPLSAPSGYLTSYNPTNVSAETKLRIINVLVAAGYPQYNLQYTSGGDMSQEDAYYVTQAAVWYARYGSAATYRTFTPNFHNKMKNGVGELYKYKTAYNTLISAADNKDAYKFDGQTVLTLNSTNGSGMSETRIGDNNRVLVSDSTFKIDDNNDNKTVQYNVQVSGTNAYIYSEDLTQNYGTSKDFRENGKFKIVIDVDESASADEYDASFTVTELDPATQYDLGFFLGSNSGGIQNLTLLVPGDGIPATLSYELRGNTTDIYFPVPYAKVDTNGQYVEGSLIGVYTSNDRLMDYWESASDAPRTIQLMEGDYYLREHLNPDGYAFNNEKVYFHVDNTGKLTSNGQEVDIVRMQDDEAYISFKKVSTDRNNSNVAGATLLIHPEGNSFTKYICGKTDSNGYLTETSPYCDNLGSEYSSANNILNDTGVYSLLELDKSYKLIVKEISPAAGFELDDNEYVIYGPNMHSIGSYGNTGAAGDVNQVQINGKSVVEYEFKNVRYIDISKVDNFDGEEIPGATMIVCRKDMTTGDCELDSGEPQKPIYMDYWESGTQPHKFLGIEKDVVYILKEALVPEGYGLLFEGILDFKLVDDGVVEMYNHTTGERISNPEQLKAVMPNEPLTKVSISKVDAAGGSEEIPGANIKICTEAAYNSALSVTGDGNNCDPTEEWVSGSTAHVVNGLDYGSYYLIETIAPAGYYSKTSATAFTISKEGKVVSVKMPNDVTKLTISKKDQVTNERIPGAELQIIDLKSGEIAKDYQGNELTWISKSDEDWVIYGIPGGKKYKLIETITPEGYQEGMIIDGQVVNEYEFYVGNKEGDINIELQLEVLNAPNTGISTLNLFAIGGLMVFAGYETIKIYRRKALND